jgi:hypothetical protein
LRLQKCVARLHDHLRRDPAQLHVPQPLAPEPVVPIGRLIVPARDHGLDVFSDCLGQRVLPGGPHDAGTAFFGFHLGLVREGFRVGQFTKGANLIGAFNICPKLPLSELGMIVTRAIRCSRIWAATACPASWIAVIHFRLSTVAIFAKLSLTFPSLYSSFGRVPNLCQAGRGEARSSLKFLFFLVPSPGLEPGWLLTDGF